MSAARPARPESPRELREAIERALSAPMGSLRDGASAAITSVETPIGPMVAAATDEGICLLEYTDRRRLEAQVTALRRRMAEVAPGEHPLVERLRAELASYFAGSLRAFTVPLVYPGTTFQERVWQALLRIPYGETRSYAVLAESIGSPDAQRAVGAANGMNRIAVVIPCHRVVNKDGRLGGYGGGLWRKERLLDLERGARSLFPG